MTHVMVDLETMGNKPDAPITAIGAVAFNTVGDGCFSDFYVTVDLSSSVSDGMAKIDPETVKWWLKQSSEAQQEMVKDNALPIGEALSEFSDWFLGVEGVEFWGNGAAFDNVILASAYDRMKRNRPWKFWNDRCYRTVKNMFYDVEMKREGTHHNALDDAKSQAYHLIEICGKKGLQV